MARDTNGTYTLEFGSPSNVQPGTTIQSAWANGTLDDIADALTNSLDRQGRGGMLAPFKFANGLEATPSITWSNEANTGFWRPGPVGDMRLSVLGSDLMRWNNTSVQIWANSQWNDVVYSGGPGGMPDGTANYQSLAWNSTNTAWEPTSSLLINYDTGNVTIAADLAVGGDILLPNSGTVDGRDVSNDGDKLDFHVDNSPLIHFDDVNNDDIQYARKNRAWVQVAASGAVVPDGTRTGQVLRWTGSVWEENEDLIITDAGWVSIGNEFGAERKLSVRDDADAQGRVAKFKSTASNVAVAQFESSGTFVQAGAVDSDFGVYVSGSLKSRQTASGLGLGTDAPAGVLDVNASTIHTSGKPLITGQGAERFVVATALPGTTAADTLYFLTG